MPRLDILILPLLGGYLFLTTFHITKFYHQHIERQRLLYHSLLVAFIFISLAYLLDYMILKSRIRLNIGCIQTQDINHYRNHISSTVDKILNHPPVKGFKHSLLALFLSYSSALLLNRFKPFNKDFAFDYTLHKWGNEFNKIIWNALSQKDDLDKLLMLTVKNNKVYIGHVTKLSEPLENTYLRIIPSLSGYREKETLKLIITTNYTDIIQLAAEKDQTGKLDEKLGVIVPISEIVFISRFDHKIFGHFNAVHNAGNDDYGLEKGALNSENTCDVY